MDAFLSLFFPTRCVGCGRFDRVLCQPCKGVLAQIASLSKLRRDTLNIPIEEVFDAGEKPETRAKHPRLHLQRGGYEIPLFTASEYTGVVKHVLVAMKHQDKPKLARELAPTLAALISLVHTEYEAPSVRTYPLLPVPSRPQKVRERGYRHLDRIIARTRGHLLPPLFTPAAARRAQVGLSLKQRKENAQLLRPTRHLARTLRVLKTPVILIDDIVTTGASMRALAISTLRAGIPVLAACTICRVARKADAQAGTQAGTQTNTQTETQGTRIHSSLPGR